MLFSQCLGELSKKQYLAGWAQVLLGVSRVGKMTGPAHLSAQDFVPTQGVCCRLTAFRVRCCGAPSKPSPVRSAWVHLLVCVLLCRCVPVSAIGMVVCARVVCVCT